VAGVPQLSYTAADIVCMVAIGTRGKSHSGGITRSSEQGSPRIARTPAPAASSATRSLPPPRPEFELADWARSDTAHAPRAFRHDDPASTIGWQPRAVSAVMLGVTGVGALSGCATARAEEIVVAPTVDYTPTAAADATAVVLDAIELDRKVDTMDPEEVDAARRALWSAYVNGGGSASALSAPAPTIELATPTRGQLVFEDLAKRIEERMRVTAWDMAHHESITFIDGAPGYKQIPESELRDMIVDALKDVPLGELPGGSSLAQIVRGLPNAGHLNAESMSFNEVTDALGDAQEAWFRARFGPFLESHKVEAIAVAAGSITAIRYASPEAAGFLDKITPKIEVLDERSESGTWRAEADLRYRDRHVLPDLDVRGSASRAVGPVTLRATATGTLSLEADEHVTGRVGVGARVGDGNTWGDLAASVDHLGRTHAGLELGHRDPSAGLSILGRADAHLGDGYAVDPSAAGRLRFTLDAGKDLKFDGGATGRVGVYASHATDTDFGHGDSRVGVMFSLRW
jgi:hypothetical protein